MTWICGARQATRTSPSAAQKHRATFGSFGHVRERDEQVRCQHRQKRKIKRSSSATAPRCSAMKDCKNSNHAGTRYLAKTRRSDTARRLRSAFRNITGHFHDGAAEHLQERPKVQLLQPFTYPVRRLPNQLGMKRGTWPLRRSLRHTHAAASAKSLTWFLVGSRRAHSAFSVRVCPCAYQRPQE